MRPLLLRSGVFGDSHRDPIGELKSRWAAFRAGRKPAGPAARPAQPRLVVGGGARVAAPARPQSQGIRLCGTPRELLDRLARLGTVVAVTRNESAALETCGTYAPPARDCTMIPHAIRLHIRPERWCEAMVVGAMTSGRPSRSLIATAADGSVVHEARVEGAEPVETFEALFADMVSQDQSPASAARCTRIPGQRRLDDLTFADVGQAWPVALWSLGVVLERAAQNGTALAITVGNAGTRQRWSGPVRIARKIGPWVTTLDDGVRLHVRGDRIAQAWVARKHRLPGRVTTLELLDANGEQVVELSGAGEHDDRAWLELIDGLVSNW